MGSSPSIPRHQSRVASLRFRLSSTWAAESVPVVLILRGEPAIPKTREGGRLLVVSGFAPRGSAALIRSLARGSQSCPAFPRGAIRYALAEHEKTTGDRKRARRPDDQRRYEIAVETVVANLSHAALFNRTDSRLAILTGNKTRGFLRRPSVTRWESAIGHRRVRPCVDTATRMVLDVSLSDTGEKRDRHDPSSPSSPRGSWHGPSESWEEDPIGELRRIVEMDGMRVPRHAFPSSSRLF